MFWVCYWQFWIFVWYLCLSVCLSPSLPVSVCLSLSRTLCSRKLFWNVQSFIMGGSIFRTQRNAHLWVTTQRECLCCPIHFLLVVKCFICFISLLTISCARALSRLYNFWHRGVCLVYLCIPILPFPSLSPCLADWYLAHSKSMSVECWSICTLTIPISTWLIVWVVE